MEVFRDSASYPVFAKAGAIVPMASHYEQDNRLINDPNLEVFVFPGNSNSFILYEDAGEYSDYKNGAFATTKFELDYSDNAVFTINSAKGDLSLIPQKRNFKINLRGFNEKVNIKVEVDNKVVDVSREYTNKTHTFIVSAKVTSEIKVYITGENLITDNGNINKMVYDMLCKAQLPFARKEVIYKSITDMSKPLHHRIFGMSCQSLEKSHTIKAIKELLTLTEEEVF